MAASALVSAAIVAQKLAYDEQVRVLDSDGLPLANMPYHIEDATGQVFKGFTNEHFLGAQRVYAYRMQFMVAAEDADRVAQELNRHFPGASSARFQAGPATGPEGSIRYSARPEFGGVVVELVTNSIAFIAALDALHLHPPAPWVVFPEIDAAAIGSLQSALDYWWTWYWLPYWNSATPDEREQLLAQASDDWREFFEFHA